MARPARWRRSCGSSASCSSSATRCCRRTSPVEGSDLIALLLDTDARAEHSAEQPFGPQAHYVTELQAALGRSDVDVVLLHRATPLLAHRVIDRGRLVFCRDDRARAAFHARALMRYLDTRPLRQLERSYLRRRLAEDRFGRANGRPTSGDGATDAGANHG